MFSNRRKARKVGAEDEDASNGSEQDSSEPVVRKPTSKPKKSSKLRLSFGPGGTSMNDDGEEDGGTVITPKKPGARRHVSGKSSLQRSWTPSGSTEHLPLRAGQDEDRPAYSKEYLNELKSSTPSTPKNVTSEQTSEDEKDKGLDIAGKFGEVVKVSGPSAIPSEAEIREKKERRARLAKEEDYIALDDADNRGWDLAHKEERLDTRLVRDDEDFAEGFDAFVEDGRIALGKKAEREQQRRERAEMKDLIEEAEDWSEEDDSEAERRAAYEASQTKAAMDGMEKRHLHLPSRPKTPPKITSLPRLANSLARLRSSLSTMESSKAQLIQRMEDLRKEKVEISTREAEIQALLKEAGENYEKLKAETGLSAEAVDARPGEEVSAHRGLESMGTATAPSPDSQMEE